MTQLATEWIDISMTIRTGMAHWPDNPPVEITSSQCMAHGDICNVSKLSLGSHTGTHVDALRHFIKDDLGIDAMPLETTVGPARVIAIEDPESIKAVELERHNIKSGERLLFKTCNSKQPQQTEEFKEDFVYIATDGAEYLAQKQVRLVGVDYLSVGQYQGNVVEVHRALLGSGIWAIEGLMLGKVAPGDYELICLPIKIANGDAGLARAIIRPLIG
ncbi:MAG: cyclase family protein [Leptolyngbyaceae cyanobacterium SM1_1_3]|nr:cyclase family protein [Leptolyngbyaceae cyanobacterium SM1_1_3]NJN03666.1 cyclase family protein [Leptolyngbyaceae cyanobacterium RM1_1_2]NJO09131.1 cyclase family protein [Leptolyngbyaceae cyanobacterium SL_1_1]